MRKPLLPRPGAPPPAPLASILLASLALAPAAWAQARYDLPLDRPYTLRNHRPFLLEELNARIILDTLHLGFAHPSPAPPGGDGGFQGPGRRRLAWRDGARPEGIGAALLLGEEFRADGDAAWSTEGGLIASGWKGPASFLLDARMFAQAGGSGSHDREEVDVQVDSVTGGVSYASFARYRGNLNWDSPVGRFTAARDAVHWGPGLYGNLVFHQDAVPFNQVRFSTSLGPVTVHSLYGELLIGRSQSFSEENLQERNLYAHRYEFRLHRDLLVGFTEQLILYDLSRPFLFVPVVPLFIAKGFMYEAANNGNLAIDAAYRLAGAGLLYGEFLLDDLESPLSLVAREYVQNKWACRLGLQWASQRPRGAVDAYGALAEWSRIEPWVYSHLRAATSQATHLGHPLGSQDGPNSMSLRAKAWLRWGGEGYAGLLAGILWKGTGPSSDPESPYPSNPLTPKRFLEGAGRPEAWLEPTLSQTLGLLTAAASAVLGPDPSAWIRLQAAY